MAVEQTLSIIKPDAVVARHIGEIIARLEAAGLAVVAARLERWTEEKAERFYAAHQGQPFYPPLVRHMISGPLVVLVLEGEAAVRRYREIMGATDPTKAAPGTLRADFGSDLPANATHGSDSPEAAAAEIAFFFEPHEVSPTA